VGIVVTIEKHPIKTRADWLRMRMQDVTASDLGSLLGMSPWKSAAQLYAEKTGKAPEQGETRVMRRGRREEPAIMKALQEERPTWTVKKPMTYFRDPALRMGCTPDCFAQDPDRDNTSGIVQLKSVAKDVYIRGWCGGDVESPPDVPIPYLLQTLCEAFLTGAPWASLGVWVRDAYTEDLVIIPVERDPVAESNICELVRQFWQDVEEGKAPPFDHKADAKVIEWFYPKERGEEVEIADNQTAIIAAEYVEARELMKELEAKKTELSTALKEKLGDAPSARLSDGTKISWKMMTRPAHEVKEWSGRVLRVTPRKAKKDAVDD
jgi:predicted phage-related endonuclease